MTRTYTKMMAFIISIILMLGMQTCLAFNPLLQGLFRVKQWGNSIGFHPMENPLKPLVVTVPWFPMSKQDLDVIRRKTLEAGSDLDANHPGFKDSEYRDRRKKIVEAASRYRHGDELPVVDYTKDEISTWGKVYRELRSSAKEHAISPFNHIISDMEQCGLYRSDGNEIPQIGKVSEYLNSKTGFTLRPVDGLLSPRDFLNGLAFKVFHSTQYIRHHSKPLYTPEPDCVHELIGHAPMLAEPDFAALSHKIGLASLAASDDDIERLATAYWFSVEFGLCMESGKLKAYGAGLLSSIGEMEYACSGVFNKQVEQLPELRTWDPAAASIQEYPITEYQPIYYVAESLQDAAKKISSFGEIISSSRPFDIVYDDSKGCIHTSSVVNRLPAPGH